MKRLTDLSALLALVTDRCRQHQTAKDWWERQSVTEVLWICRPVQMGLLRLLCTDAVMGPDVLALPQAWGVYARLLASDRFLFALEPPGLDAVWARFCAPFRSSPKIVMDAYLAAFAVAGDYRLVTLDHALAQFPGLGIEVPA